MPAFFAHHDFGQCCLSSLCPSLQKLIKAHQREYDVGLQGPDIFFNYQPTHKNPVSEYGISRHHEPASRMFFPAIQSVQGNEAAMVYLLGLTCHFILDRECHPYVNLHCPTSREHFYMESAFETYLLKKSGQKTSRYLLLPTRGLDIRAMTLCWPGMSEKEVKSSIQSMRFNLRLLDHDRLIQTAESLLHQTGRFSSMLLPRTVPADQQMHIQALDERFNQALAYCPITMQSLYEAIGDEKVQLNDFNWDYEGMVHDESTRAGLDSL